MCVWVCVRVRGWGGTGGVFASSNDCGGGEDRGAKNVCALSRDNDVNDEEGSWFTLQ